MPPATTYLVGITFHEPEAFAAWNRGVIEDCESSTGVFIDAVSREEALEWGEAIGKALLRFVNGNDELDWKGFGYFAWIEDTPEAGSWKHCLDFFPRVATGTMPDLSRMTSAAYEEWRARTGA